MLDLETARLTVTPFTPALAGVALTGRARLGHALGVRMPDDWLPDDSEEILPLIAATVRGGPPGGADLLRVGLAQTLYWAKSCCTRARARGPHVYPRGTHTPRSAVPAAGM